MPPFWAVIHLDTVVIFLRELSEIPRGRMRNCCCGCLLCSATVELNGEFSVQALKLMAKLVNRAAEVKD